jgi:hypothetical protein
VPSPIAHTFMGWVVYRICRRQIAHADEGWVGPFPWLLVATTGLSILPDLDVVPGILMGDLGRFHNNVMSSLMAGLVVALGVGGFVGLSQHSGFLKWFVLTLGCYELHLIMDFFTVGRGIMLFWPFSTNRYQSPVKLFYGLRWSDGWVSVRHLWTLLTELGFVVLVGLIMHVSKSKNLKKA